MELEVFITAGPALGFFIGIEAAVDVGSLALEMLSHPVELLRRNHRQLHLDRLGFRICAGRRTLELHVERTWSVKGRTAGY